ncbi:MAG TPA: DUF3301 domain-containing protein [Gammaproteobacteria bacterium]|nr:DUF3301 domain-containing protein [Gammaproteobacteria bacterium]
MDAVILLLCLGLLVWLWQNNLRYREHAIRHCRRVCHELQIQLLDQTIALSSVSIGRDYRQRLKLRRRFVFEVSADGATRHNGYIVMLGEIVVHTEIDLPEGPLILHGNDLITYH